MKVSLLLVSCLCYLFGLAAPSHFRGGIIQWRPVNSRAFDGRVSSIKNYIRTTNALLTLCSWLALSHTYFTQGISKSMIRF